VASFVVVRHDGQKGLPALAGCRAVALEKRQAFIPVHAEAGGQMARDDASTERGPFHDVQRAPALLRLRERIESGKGQRRVDVYAQGVEVPAQGGNPAPVIEQGGKRRRQNASLERYVEAVEPAQQADVVAPGERVLHEGKA